MIQTIEHYVKAQLKDDYSGHDWQHISRVRTLAVNIAKHENANVQICEIAALLHDCIDDKICDNTSLAYTSVKQLLTSLLVNKHAVEHILSIITTMSFSYQLENEVTLSLEGKIVQDADRLDAIGAIGIGRTFMYGGAKQNRMYDESILPKNYGTKQAYRNSESTVINHFYEKLLLLKDAMHTTYAKQLAHKRHAFMEQFLEQFKHEWYQQDTIK